MAWNVYIKLVMSIIAIISDAIRADADIKWGNTSANCKKEVAKREHSTDNKVVQKNINADIGEHIVGIFVTRFPENNAIWSHTFINKHKTCILLDFECKKICHKNALASYSLAGVSKQHKPTAIQITMTTNMNGVCKFGYTIEVCFEQVK